MICGGELSAAAQFQLLKDVSQVHLDGGLTDGERAGELLVPHPHRGKAKDLLFPIAEQRAK